MRGKKELFALTWSAVFFLVDLGTDIFLAVEYNRKGEALWFLLTLLFVLGPHVVIITMAVVNAKGDFWKKIRVFPQSLLFSLLVHYYEQFRHWKRKYRDNAPCEGSQGSYKKCSCKDCELYREVVKESNESAYEMAWYRYVETIAESAPQWCLQVSIMLAQWNFPSLTVTSAVFSFFSLALSITSLEKAKVIKEGRDFKSFDAAVFFFFTMFTLLSRLSAIVFHIFAYPGGEWLYFFAGHWILIVWLLMDGNGCCVNFCCFVCFNIASIPFFIHPTKAYYLWLGMKDDWYCCFYILISAENLIITLIAVFLPGTGVTHLSVLTPTVLSFVPTGLVLGSFCGGIYYNNCCCQQDNAEDVEAQNA